MVQANLGSTGRREIYEIHGAELWRRRKSFLPISRLESASRDYGTSAFRRGQPIILILKPQTESDRAKNCLRHNHSIMQLPI